MSSSQRDIFARCAAECQLALRAHPLVGGPRDVLADLEETDHFYLVTLGSRVSDATLQTIFVKPAVNASPPDLRDVLWWLASDAWVVRQSGREREQWAREHRYPPGAEATARLFEQHLLQNDALVRLLGEAEYQRLLALYDAESSRVGKS